MAQTNSIPTTTTLAKGYHKATSTITKSLQEFTNVFKRVSKMPRQDMAPGYSPREMLIKLDVNPSHVGSQIVEGGYESRTDTPALEEGSVSFVHMNKRLGITIFSSALGQKARDGQIVKQLVYQGEKLTEGAQRGLAMQWLGNTTGYIAALDGNPAGGAATGHTLTLKNPWGQASIVDNTTTAGKNYLARLFVPGEGVALIRSGALVTNAIGTVDAAGVNTTNGTVAVTWGGTVTPLSGDFIVFANTVTDSTITATDYTRFPVGVFSLCFDTTVHGLSGSSVLNWNPAFSDVAGGRLTWVRIRGMKQAIDYYGSKTMNALVMSPGVANDLLAGERAALRYTDAMMLSLDAKFVDSGIEYFEDALIPPGFCAGYDKSAFAHADLQDLPQGPGDAVDPDMMDKVQDVNAHVGSVDYSYFYACRARLGFGYFTGLSTQGF